MEIACSDQAELIFDYIVPIGKAKDKMQFWECYINGKQCVSATTRDASMITININ